MKDAVFSLKGHPNNLRVISPKDRFYFLVALSPLGIWNKSCNLQTIKTYQLKFLGLVVRFVSSSKSKNLSTFFCGCFFLSNNTYNNNLRLEIEALLLNSEQKFFFHGFNLIKNVHNLNNHKKKSPKWFIYKQRMK